MLGGRLQFELRDAAHRQAHRGEMPARADPRGDAQAIEFRRALHAAERRDRAGHIGDLHRGIRRTQSVDELLMRRGRTILRSEITGDIERSAGAEERVEHCAQLRPPTAFDPQRGARGGRAEPRAGPDLACRILRRHEDPRALHAAAADQQERGVGFAESRQVVERTRLPIREELRDR